MASIPNARMDGGGGLCSPTREVIIICIIYFIYYFLFYANPLPSFIPRSLNLHNRLVEDCAAAEEEDVVEMEALLEEPEEPEEPEDLSESIVCKKIMRNRAHAEALPIFYSALKWREIRRATRMWRGVHCRRCRRTV